MRHIVSRSFKLPTSASEMEAATWFSLWRRKIWPYVELEAGDCLYWYETRTKHIVWKTYVTDVYRSMYDSLPTIIAKLSLTEGEQKQSYLSRVPDAGHCLAWWVADCTSVQLPKPHGVQMPYEGWLRGDSPSAVHWLGAPSELESEVARVEASDDAWAALAELSLATEDSPPARASVVVDRILRKDTAIVNAVKKAAGYRCQFPGCTAHIRQRGGGSYVEVAHVEPVARGGKSVLGNLVVLCPNHHKELDLGDLCISIQETSRLCGTLNGVQFEMRLPWS